MEDSKDNPLVTVVIPMFNAYPFIGEMLECMIHQTYTNWELIIVDDGSTDGCVGTVDKFAKNDARIKLIRRPENRKKGGNTCRNIGLENANGEYIIWFDADDLVASYCLEQRVDFLISNKAIDIGVSPLIKFHKIPYDYNGSCIGFYPEEKVIKKFLANTPYFLVVTNIYRIQSLKEANICWDENLKSHQDVDMNLECFYKDLRISSIPDAKIDYFWRVSGNPESVSKKIYTQSHFQTNIYYFNKQVKRFGGNTAEKKYLKLLTNYLYKILLFQSECNWISEFLSQPYFVIHKWLKFRLSLVNKIQKRLNIKSHIPANLLTLLLCPLFEINYRIEIYLSDKFQKKLAKRLLDEERYGYVHDNIIS